MDSISLPTGIHLTCVPLAIAAYGCYLFGQKDLSGDSVSNKDFLGFQRTYFLPFFLALFSDWLQGPYVYKLYAHYGFPQNEIAILYVVGFAASCTFGTATGPIADKFGRKRMTLAFCALYIVCCLTKLSPNFNILLLGRVLGGVSTSLLFSAFETWLVHEHTVHYRFPSDWLSLTFSKATFFNGLLAIAAGIVAQSASDWAGFGPVAPFILAIPCLVVAFFIIYTQWEENYGEKNMAWRTSCVEGLVTIFRNKNILALGCVQALFEANMYIFVFLWTPVLEPGHPPLGLTFSSFMLAIMVGSSLFTILLKYNWTNEEILCLCMTLMGSSLLVCVWSKEYLYIDYLSFLVLEVAVGLYFPCIGRLRADTIPDGLRANIMNWFRVPMNILTCGALLAMHHVDVSHSGKGVTELIFLVCAVAAFLGLMVARIFAKLPKTGGNGKESEDTADLIINA